MVDIYMDTENANSWWDRVKFRDFNTNLRFVGILSTLVTYKKQD